MLRSICRCVETLYCCVGRRVGTPSRVESKSLASQSRIAGVNTTLLASLELALSYELNANAMQNFLAGIRKTTRVKLERSQFK